MELAKYKKFIIIILLCELRNNIAKNCCYDCCYDCCCGICHDCINLETINNNGEDLNENLETVNKNGEDLNENYDFVINDDNHIDNKNFIAVNYENSKNKYSLEGLKTINSTCFNLKGDEYSKLKDIYMNAFLFFVNIKEEDGSYQKTENYIFEGEDIYGHYKFKENINIERNQVPFWNWFDILIQNNTKSFSSICKNVINLIQQDSPIYDFREIVFFLFGYLNEFIEKNKEKKTFTIEEYTSQVESMLKIFLYITQGLNHCAAGQYEALQIAFINILDDFLKHNDIKINTKELCGLALNLYAKKIFNMVFTFTKIQEKDYINISRIASKEKYKDMLEKEKSMFTIYINNLISEYFGFKYEKTQQPLAPIIGYYAIDYESIKFLVLHNTYEKIKFKKNSIEIDPDKIDLKNTDEQYVEEKKMNLLNYAQKL